MLSPLPKGNLATHRWHCNVLCVLRCANKSKIYKSLVLKCDKKYIGLDNMHAAVKLARTFFLP
jgi:hypothetical protein